MWKICGVWATACCQCKRTQLSRSLQRRTSILGCTAIAVVSTGRAYVRSFRRRVLGSSSTPSLNGGRALSVPWCTRRHAQTKLCSQSGRLFLFVGGRKALYLPNAARAAETSVGNCYRRRVGRGRVSAIGHGWMVRSTVRRCHGRAKSTSDGRRGCRRRLAEGEGVRAHPSPARHSTKTMR
jgi:hypothetical protein